MAKLDTTHVRNVGEFYSQHYLDAVLADDLKDVFARWSATEKDGGAKAPDKQLAKLTEPYFRALADFQGNDDPETAAKICADFHARFIEALGYSRVPTKRTLPDGSEVPLTLALELHGRPYLWVVEAPFPQSDDEADPLSEAPLDLSVEEPEGDEVPAPAAIKELLDGPLLRQDDPPRWVILLAGPDAFLIDRDKWAQGQYLRFEVGAMLGHRKPAALRALAGLLHQEVLIPEGGRSLLDQIDEKSHKHAFAVSTDLKHGVQRAIELLGNEVVYYKREVSKEKVFDKPEMAGELARECITYMYRLLFLFFVEARGGEIGAVPMKADAYRMGLSLESLRDLELVPLTTDHARNGFFIHHSLNKLFELVHLGWPTKSQRHIKATYGTSVDLVVPPQRSPLFDKARTPLISSVKLRNHVLQEVIRLLSLSKEASGRKQRGRISYAQLGINQLGAVYEGLLSYTGFFAQEDTFEIRNPKDNKDDSARIFYVGRSRIDDYVEEEFRKTESGAKIFHPKGTFLFRLAGRDREKSASFYTPEVLTKCLTKYTLKERLGEPGEDGALTADEILELTICEPAMGSGAFLNEAVSQLAHAYLERKQAETGVQIPAEDYQREWLRVKYHFVVHNCYGVDLNPLAAELGKVSLWLGVLQPGVQAPYLDMRIKVGNSLIGARREVYAPEDLMKKPNKKTGVVNWLGKPPTRIKPGEKRPKGHVYHFLVPDAGMAPYEKDKVVKKLCPDEIAALKKWRKEITKPFTKKEVEKLQELSDTIDELWEAHRAKRVDVLKRLRQPIQIWGQPEIKLDGVNRWKTVEECEGIAAELERPGDPGARLRAVMDYWCELWMWPLERVDKLPERRAWVALVNDTLYISADRRPMSRFLHWDLEFADLFHRNRGFDVSVGNPPWIKLEWQESGVLGDLDPKLALRKQNATEVANLRAELLTAELSKSIYFGEFAQTLGSQAFLGAPSNYPLLQGVKTNLYKCFILRALQSSCPRGQVGLLHESGLLDDPRGGRLREALATRWKLIARFKNELRLFSEVKPEKRYCFSVIASQSADDVSFMSFSELYHPTTIDESLAHDGLGPVPMIKTDAGQWNLSGHAERAVHIRTEHLRLFSSLYDSDLLVPARSRIPVVYSEQFIEILGQFSRAPRTLRDLEGQYFCTQHHNETLQRKDGTIMRKTTQPSNPVELIVSGPHFYVGSPINKTPREHCRLNTDYDTVDLTLIADDYLPRTNYVPACSAEEYARRTPDWDGTKVTAYYRHVHREMVAPTGERTLAPAIIPPGTAHVNSVFGIAFRDEAHLLDYTGMSQSLPVDFFVKSTGMGHVNKTLAEQLFLASGKARSIIHDRTLRLNCVTSHYAALWNRHFPAEAEGSSRDDPRCARWGTTSQSWDRSSPLRTPYSRRQALVEIDALSALVLGLSVDDLILLYRTYFRILRGYEMDTFYDRRGKVVFTKNSKGLSGVGVTRKQWNEIRDAQAGDTLPDWAHDQQGPYEPPFDRCDREVDMAQAYTYFQDKLGLPADAPKN